MGKIAVAVVCFLVTCTLGCARKFQPRVVQVHGPRVADDPAVQGNPLEVQAPADPGPREPDESEIVSKTRYESPVDFELAPGATKDLTIVVPEPAVVSASCIWRGIAGEALEVRLSEGGAAPTSAQGASWKPGEGQTAVRRTSNAAGTVTVWARNPGTATLKVRAFLSYTPLSLFERRDR